ncbi:MAG: hypothetical protein ABIK31_04285 [candidate division WOR-3 bacterium]
MYKYPYKRIGERPKDRKKKLIIYLSIFFLVVAFFIPGPNGLARVIYKYYQKQCLHKDIEQLKIKAELIQAKINKSKDERYLKKYLQDNYQMIPAETISP